jgi:hypothetical protein
MFSFFEVVDAIYIDNLPPFLTYEISKGASKNEKNTIRLTTDEYIIKEWSIKEKWTDNIISEDDSQGREVESERDNAEKHHHKCDIEVFFYVFFHNEA